MNCYTSTKRKVTWTKLKDVFLRQTEIVILHYLLKLLDQNQPVPKLRKGHGMEIKMIRNATK